MRIRGFKPSASSLARASSSIFAAACAASLRACRPSMSARADRGRTATKLAPRALERAAWRSYTACMNASFSGLAPGHCSMLDDSAVPETGGAGAAGAGAPPAGMACSAGLTIRSRIEIQSATRSRSLGSILRPIRSGWRK
jgi:hypothetical protein